MNRKRRRIHDLMTYTLLGHLSSVNRILEQLCRSPEFKAGFTEKELKYLKGVTRENKKNYDRIYKLYYAVKFPKS